MSLIKVDPQVLRVLAASLNSAVNDIQQVVTNNAALDGLITNAGSELVTAAASEFLSAWTYGLRFLQQDAQTLTNLLNQAGDYYTDTDESIGTAATQ